jgi:hypothetical protein
VLVFCVLLNTVLGLGASTLKEFVLGCCEPEVEKPLVVNDGLLPAVEEELGLEDLGDVEKPLVLNDGLEELEEDPLDPDGL